MPLLDISTGLYDMLSNGTALTDYLGGTYIYNTMPPTSASLPYVILQAMGGGFENVTPRDSVDERWMVKTVSYSPIQAGSADNLICDILNHGTLSVTGWTHIDLSRRERIWYAETLESRITYHGGAVYRVRLSRV
jgi:hypothetical protein